MFTSLTSRIAAVGIMVATALFVLVLAIVDASRQSRESFQWVMHSSQIIQAMEETMAGLRDAESGQRGYVLTQNPGLAQSFERRIEDARQSYGQLYELTKDNPVQNRRVREFGVLMDERVELMNTPLQMARQNAFNEARTAISEGRGHETMNALVLIAQDFLNEEEAIRDKRIMSAERRLAWGRGLALFGGPLIALLTLLLSAMAISRIRYPTRVLDAAMTRFGQGEMDARVEEKMGSKEFDRLAHGYNAMAQKLETTSAAQERSKAELRRVHDELLASSQTLKERGEVMELLGAMSHRMQATRTDEELAEVISIFVPRVMPDLPGALYAYNNSRNLLVPMSVWGEPRDVGQSFAPDKCWALRRGQEHYVSGKGKDVVCDHVHEDVVAYHCEPLLASGEVIGVLYMDGILDSEARFRMSVLVENIASAMTNRRLQRDLKEQTIRDPLTGLFNRRYMEEALALEVARASRADTPLCVVMCDVDHFKRFNDEYGHDAGDAVLALVASELGERFRDGDIVCRYGGEEFTIIAPGTTKEDLLRRVENVREAMSKLSPRLRNQLLGSITMSFGISQWNPDMERTGADLLKHADAALYQAKRDGRNRTVMYEAGALTSAE
ncbi:diguanylate cyclase [Brevundimonas sp. BH3]|uniref:sensor domain-containing diguanylate cyclase n=1 Tax=unclassified Brevundimonas TaxID=2622653 RepID=UPI0028A09D8A|nr:diguanylate cyclase [Brevundimonas sp.]